MVTDDMLNPRLAAQRAQVAQYWQRCYESRADCKLSRSLSASTTHNSDDDSDDDDDDDVVDIELDDEPEDAEYRYVHYRRRSARVVSGLPLLCGNCGVSFFSLQSVDDEDECYCSGECKWSVIMYREMDRRMCALRASRARANGAATGSGARQRGSCQYSTTDDGIPCH